MSERVFKFLKRRLEAEHAAMLAAGEDRRIVWDTEIAGFGVRLTKSGGLAFLDYRDRTKAKRRVTICKLIPQQTRPVHRAHFGLDLFVPRGAGPRQSANG